MRGCEKRCIICNLAGFSLPTVIFVGARVTGMLGCKFSPARGGTSVGAVESPAIASRADG